MMSNQAISHHVIAKQIGLVKVGAEVVKANKHVYFFAVVGVITPLNSSGVLVHKFNIDELKTRSNARFSVP